MSAWRRKALELLPEERAVIEAAEGPMALDETPMNESIGETVGYHIRSGAHDLTDFDWLLYLDFADRHLEQ